MAKKKVTKKKVAKKKTITVPKKETVEPKVKKGDHLFMKPQEVMLLERKMADFRSHTNKRLTHELAKQNIELRLKALERDLIDETNKIKKIEQEANAKLQNYKEFRDKVSMVYFKEIVDYGYDDLTCRIYKVEKDK